MPDIQPTWAQLVCTRCGDELYVELRDEGSAYQSWRVVDCIECQFCGARWDRHGRPQVTAWLRELGGKPDA